MEYDEMEMTESMSVHIENKSDESGVYAVARSASYYSGDTTYGGGGSTGGGSTGGSGNTSGNEGQQGSAGGSDTGSSNDTSDVTGGGTTSGGNEGQQGNTGNGDTGSSTTTTTTGDGEHNNPNNNGLGSTTTTTTTTTTTINGVPVVLVKSISVSPSSLTMKVCQVRYLTANIYPENASNKNVYWTSSNNNVARVSGGVVTALAKGTAIIAAMSEDGSNVKGACVVTVCDINCPEIGNTFAAAQEIEVERLINGYIGSSSDEQWFKFVAPQSGTYTIYTTGTLDTVGTLYNRYETVVCEVDDYTPCGQQNFRIIEYLYVGEIYYIRVKAKNSSYGNYCLRVTQDRLVDYVSVEQSPIILNTDTIYELPILPNTFTGVDEAEPISSLAASVVPADATEKKVLWSSFNSNVVSISTGWHNGERYQTLTPLTSGITTIYAYDWNGHGKSGECTVYVGGAPVTGITLDCAKKIITLHDSEQLIATVYPTNALNKRIIWSSSNEEIAEVDEDGWVTANRVGTATITATTEEGNFIARCVVTVDRREKVIVEKDINYSNSEKTYFNIIFSDGNIWRNIGIDLSNRQDNYNGNPDPPVMIQDNYDYLIVEEQRYMDNVENIFTIEQIAYIYLFDPLGIEYYMKTNAGDKRFDGVSGESLKFKDDVYEAIFGTTERNRNQFYYVIENGEPRYLRGTYSGSNRMQVYSHAEVLFGFHTIMNWDWSVFIKSVLEGLFNLIIVDYKRLSFKPFVHARYLLPSHNIVRYFFLYVKEFCKNFFK